MEVGNHTVIEVTRLFASDVLLPTQVSHPPEDGWLRHLCRAVLEDALKYVAVRGGYGGPSAHARYRREAWAWFGSDAEYCFSFPPVCAVLQLDVEALRTQLLQRFAQGGEPLAPCSSGLRQPLFRASSASSVQRPERRARRKSK